MRGFSNLLTRERDPGRYRTGVFLATATPGVVESVLVRLSKLFPLVRFVFITPQQFAMSFRYPGQVVTFEDIKSSPLRSLLELRKQRFDICVAVFADDPTFRRGRLMSLFLNVRRLFVFNQYGDWFVCDRKHWRNLYASFRRSSKPRRSFFLVGAIYLLVRGSYLSLRRRSAQ